MSLGNTGAHVSAGVTLDGENREGGRPHSFVAVLALARWDHTHFLLPGAPFVLLRGFSHQHRGGLIPEERGGSRFGPWIATPARPSGYLCIFRITSVFASLDL